MTTVHVHVQKMQQLTHATCPFLKQRSQVALSVIHGTRHCRRNGSTMYIYTLYNGIDKSADTCNARIHVQCTLYMYIQIHVHVQCMLDNYMYTHKLHCTLRNVVGINCGGPIREVGALQGNLPDV